MFFITRKDYEEAICAERRKLEEEMWKREQENRMEKRICELEIRVYALERKLGIRVEENCCESKVNA